MALLLWYLQGGELVRRTFMHSELGDSHKEYFRLSIRDVFSLLSRRSLEDIFTFKKYIPRK